jgi:hypothetical protein
MQPPTTRALSFPCTRTPMHTHPHAPSHPPTTHAKHRPTHAHLFALTHAGTYASIRTYTLTHMLALARTRAPRSPPSRVLAALLAAPSPPVPGTADSTGLTPLHVATDTAAVQLLLAAGAPVDARTHSGDTPLHTARDAEVRLGGGGGAGRREGFLASSMPPRGGRPEQPSCACGWVSIPTRMPAC